MHRYILFFSILFIITWSCNERSNIEQTHIQQVNDSAAVLEVVRSDENFKTYWKRFRAAVMAKGDSNELKRVIENPLKVRGMEDIDPILAVFASSYKSMIELYKIDHGPEDKSRVNFFKNLQNIDDYVEDYSAGGGPIIKYNSSDADRDGEYRIDNLVFERTQKGWKLIEMYVVTSDLNRFKDLNYKLIKSANDSYNWPDEQSEDSTETINKKN